MFDCSHPCGYRRWESTCVIRWSGVNALSAVTWPSHYRWPSDISLCGKGDGWLPDHSWQGETKITGRESTDKGKYRLLWEGNLRQKHLAHLHMGHLGKSLLLKSSKFNFFYSEQMGKAVFYASTPLAPRGPGLCTVHRSTDPKPQQIQRTSSSGH